MKHFEDINDDEIGIIGYPGTPTPRPRKPLYRQWWFWAMVTVVFAILVAVVLMMLKPSPKTEPLETMEAVPEAVAPTLVRKKPATILVCDTVINDVTLRLYTPVNALPELCIGYPIANGTVKS